MKKYEVLIQDEWNNLYQMGFYNTLDGALPDVNEFLEVYDTKLESISERASTFGPCFDTEVITPNDDIILVRGFILDWEKVVNEESND
jgi:hypothetical protein